MTRKQAVAEIAAEIISAHKAEKDAAEKMEGTILGQGPEAVARMDREATLATMAARLDVIHAAAEAMARALKIAIAADDGYYPNSADYMPPAIRLSEYRKALRYWNEANRGSRA